jgi:hypothetical protein
MTRGFITSTWVIPTRRTRQAALTKKRYRAKRKYLRTRGVGWGGAAALDKKKGQGNKKNLQEKRFPGEKGLGNEIALQKTLQKNLQEKRLQQ